MDKPPIAVIIATYDSRDYILDAIQSASAQDYPNVTIFVTDDHSTDDSLEVIRNFCGSTQQIAETDDLTLEVCNTHKFPIYLFALKKNVGRGGVRNYSITFALQNRFPLVQILDADDRMREDKLSKLSEVILSDPQNIGVAYGDYIIYNEETGVTHYESKPTYDLQRLAQGQNMIHSGSMINSAAIAKVGLYNPALAVTEDLNLWLKIAKYFMIIGVPEPLTWVRSHSRDSTNSVSKEAWQENYRRAVTNI